MQKFSPEHLLKFKHYFQVKESVSDIEERLWFKVKKYVPPLAFIPWILFVWVGNSLSMNSCHKNSDIDLFIITRPNRLWTVRILTTLYFTLLGQRKTARKHAGKFCLSFFVTEDSLDFSNFAIADDIYLYFWIVFLKPIVDKENTYEHFLEAQKSWADFTEYKNIFEENRQYVNDWWKTQFLWKIEKSWKIWDTIETFLKKIFLPKTQKSFLKLGKPFGVIITDDILKFHDRDRRKEISSYLL